MYEGGYVLSDVTVQYTMPVQGLTRHLAQLGTEYNILSNHLCA